MGSPLHTFLETVSVGWTGVVLGGVTKRTCTLLSHSATSTVSPGSDSQSKQYGHTHRNRRPRACKVRENFYAFEQLLFVPIRTLIHISNSVPTCPMLGHGRRATSLFDRHQAVRSVITMQTGNLKVYIIHTPNCILIVQTDEYTRGYLMNVSNFSSYRGQ